MWFENRHAGQTGYAVATSPTAAGPFVVLSHTVNMTTDTKIETLIYLLIPMMIARTMSGQAFP